MRRCNLNLSLISFHPSLFSLFICTLTTSSHTSAQLMPDPLQDIVCALINCGNGECKASNASLLGFDCECNPGWKKIQIGPLTFPSCLVPNCTLDLECGNGSPPPPPPPPPVAPPPLNLSNPCGLVWCGEGTCMTNGTAYSCQCYEGAANLMNLTGLPCFNECSFGADCNGHGFGNKQASPPPPVPSGASGNGLPEVVPNCSRKLCALTMIMLAAIFLTWV